MFHTEFEFWFLRIVCVLIMLLIFPWEVLIQNRSPGTHSKKLDFKLLFLPFWDHFFYFWDHQCFVFRLSFCLIIRFFVHIFRELLSLRDPRLDWSSLCSKNSLWRREEKGAQKHPLREVGWVKKWNFLQIHLGQCIWHFHVHHQVPWER